MVFILLSIPQTKERWTKEKRIKEIEKRVANKDLAAGFTKEHDDKFPMFKKETNVTNKKLTVARNQKSVCDSSIEITLQVSLESE